MPGRLEGGGIAALSTSDSILGLLGLNFLIMFSSLEDDLKQIVIDYENQMSTDLPAWGRRP